MKPPAQCDAHELIRRLAVHQTVPNHLRPDLFDAISRQLIEGVMLRSERDWLKAENDRLAKYVPESVSNPRPLPVCPPKRRND